jgi:hypothetical protein
MTWTQEGTLADSEGNQVRAYDDVVLMSAVPVRDQGNGPQAEVVPAGSQATVLFFTSTEPVQLDLECYVDKGFCFAQSNATNVRLSLRNEDKYAAH